MTRRRGAQGKTRILVLDKHDPEREFEFELDWLMSLTSKQRYEMMLRLSTDALKRMIHDGYLKPVEIVERPARPVRRHRRNGASRARLRALHS